MCEWHELSNQIVILHTLELESKRDRWHSDREYHAMLYSFFCTSMRIYEGMQRLYSTNRYLNVTFCCSSTKLTLGAQTERTLAPATDLLVNYATGGQNKAVVTSYSWQSRA